MNGFVQFGSWVSTGRKVAVLDNIDDLRQLPKRELTAVHQCAGNPMAPKVPTRRVANETWGGVDLVAVIEKAGVDPEAKFLRSFGTDYGHFDAFIVPNMERTSRSPGFGKAIY